MDDLGKAAEWLCELLPPASLPHELVQFSPDTIVLVVDMGGVDYILTLAVVPKQRKRPRPM